LKKILAVVLLVAICAVLFSACGSPDPETAIVGSWRCHNSTIPHEWMCELVFNEDGTFVDRDGDTGTFTVRGNQVTLDFDYFGWEITLTTHFTNNGNRMRITADEGGTRVIDVTLRRD